MVYSEQFRAQVESAVSSEPQTAVQIWNAVGCWSPSSVRQTLRELSDAKRIKTELRPRSGNNKTRFYWRAA